MTLTAPAHPIRFGPFTLDAAAGQLTRHGQALALRPKAFELLRLLAGRPGELFSKDTLLDSVWGRRFISEGVIKSVVSELRGVLDGDAGQPSWIETVPRRGYRFAGPVTAPEVNGDVAPSPPAQTPTPTPPPNPGNLPATLPPPIGRAADLAALTALLGTQRLVTIAGPSGVGKTRLVQALAMAQQNAWADGVWFIELAPMAAESTDAATLRALLAQTLQLGAGAAQDNAGLGRALQPLSLLLVLDNAEHLLPALAPLVADLLAQAPALRIVATSQEPLGVPSEQVFRLAPLAVPAAADDASAQALMASAAVHLFVTRVAAQLPGFALAPQQQQAVAEICRALDGLPLALELAAARVPVLGVHGIARVLLGGESADDDAPGGSPSRARLNLLNQGARTAAPRQRTLRDALQWSHDLLDDTQRAVFRRLGVFRGGFSLEAAQGVCTAPGLDDWAVLDAVQALVDKSLLVATPSTAAPRFMLLESLRAFALERLHEAGEREPTRQRHLQTTRAAWARADLRALSEPALPWLARHLPEVDNLRAALRFALSDPAHTDDALALLAGAGMLWPRAGLVAEGVAACEALRAHAATTSNAALRRGFALTQAILTVYGNAYAKTAPELAATLPTVADEFEQAGDPARAYFALYLANRLQVRYQASAHSEPMLARMKALEQPGWSELLTRYHRFAAGYQLRLAGQTEAYLRFCQDELARCRRLGAALESWTTAQGLMLAEQDMGHAEAAVQTGRDAIAEIRQHGRLREQSALLILWATMLAESGDTAGTRQALGEALPALHSGGTAWMAHPAFAWLAAHEGRHRAAAQLLGWHDAAQQSQGRVRPGLYIGRVLHTLEARLARTLGADVLAQERQRGAVLGDAAAERLALEGAGAGI